MDYLSEVRVYLFGLPEDIIIYISEFFNSRESVPLLRINRYIFELLVKRVWRTLPMSNLIRYTCLENGDGSYTHRKIIETFETKDYISYLYKQYYLG
jgi:hypothetical protein